MKSRTKEGGVSPFFLNCHPVHMDAYQPPLLLWSPFVAQYLNSSKDNVLNLHILKSAKNCPPHNKSYIFLSVPYLDFCSPRFWGMSNKRNPFQIQSKRASWNWSVIIPGYWAPTGNIDSPLFHRSKGRSGTGNFPFAHVRFSNSRGSDWWRTTYKEVVDQEDYVRGVDNPIPVGVTQY